jgi:major membrane immunogen (membrane-anchored lipoprotein)
MTNMLEVLDKKIEEQVQQLVDVVSGGGAKSHDHYKELCGTIRGLQTAQYELADLVRKTKEYEDD